MSSFLTMLPARRRGPSAVERRDMTSSGFRGRMLIIDTNRPKLGLGSSRHSARLTKRTRELPRRKRATSPRRFPQRSTDLWERYPSLHAFAPAQKYFQRVPRFTAWSIASMIGSVRRRKVRLISPFNFLLPLTLPIRARSSASSPRVFIAPRRLSSECMSTA